MELGFDPVHVVGLARWWECGLALDRFSGFSQTVGVATTYSRHHGFSAWCLKYTEAVETVWNSNDWLLAVQTASLRSELPSLLHLWRFVSYVQLRDGGDIMSRPMTPNLFHPAVESWFRKNFTAATRPQELAWPSIKDRRNTLVSAPTGSGKTLAAFLAAIDDLVRLGIEGNLADVTHVVYVSPLKALSNDIQINLQKPLEGIAAELQALGLPEVNIRTLVRTGDTPASERTAMIKRPPHIVVTTPESLYILLTSEGGRRMLKTARTLIVDEIHAMVGDKRGSHLALSIERLQSLVENKLVRIGLSATQKPIEEVARFLVGNTNIDEKG